MSNLVYPVLPGLQFPLKKTPMWSTGVKGTPSGREFRTKQMIYPRYKYGLQYEFLRDTAGFLEADALAGFFNRVGGSFDTFLFTDPGDSNVVAQVIGTGDGLTSAYQIVRTLGGMVEPVYDFNGAFTVYLNGTPTVAFTHNGSGGLTFTGGPVGLGVVITWTGSFYWRCRFNADNLTLDQFMQQFWSAGSVELLTCKP
ncbi:MAG: DUF2460 domain-containing protein [Leptothrix sp. (in: b-proteobacteria)]